MGLEGLAALAAARRRWVDTDLRAACMSDLSLLPLSFYLGFHVIPCPSRRVKKNGVSSLREDAPHIPCRLMGFILFCKTQPKLYTVHRNRLSCWLALAVTRVLIYTFVGSSSFPL